MSLQRVVKVLTVAFLLMMLAVSVWFTWPAAWNTCRFPYLLVVKRFAKGTWPFKRATWFGRVLGAVVNVAVWLVAAGMAYALTSPEKTT